MTCWGMNEVAEEEVRVSHHCHSVWRNGVNGKRWGQDKDEMPLPLSVKEQEADKDDTRVRCHHHYH